MSFLKGLIGGVAGFFLGGPAGAVAGYGLGSSLDAGDAASKAATASTTAAATQADYQKQALDYLKSQNALPTEIRDQALKHLQTFYNDPAQAPKSQPELIQQAMDSPLYGAIMGTEHAGEQAVLRNASATGKLRSGGTIGELTDYGQQTQNRALLTAYDDAKNTNTQNLQGIGALAQLPTNTNAIANGTAGIGSTLAQGQVAAGQAEQQGAQNGQNNLLGILGLGLKAYGMNYGVNSGGGSGSPFDQYMAKI